MAEQKQRRKTAAKPAPEREQDDASYGPAKPFQRKKLALQLLTVVAVALAIAVGLSIFFKVDTITVSGLERYSYESVRDASGILEGDSLLFFSRAEVSSKIMQALPYVRSVRIGITLPGTVQIVVEEVRVTYALQDTVGYWWLISADGMVLETVDAATANTHTNIRGITLADPVVGQQAVASKEGDSQTVTGADRLQAALAVAQAMEKNEILGKFTEMDVSNPYDLQLWYGKDYQFCLGDESQLEMKLAYIRGAMDKILDDYPPGKLDVSKVDETADFPYTQFRD